MESANMRKRDDVQESEGGKRANGFNHIDLYSGKNRVTNANQSSCIRSGISPNTAKGSNAEPIRLRGQALVIMVFPQSYD